MYKTSSINWNAVSIKELIWIEAAFFVDGELNAKLKEAQLSLNNDLRFLLKDLDDLKRLQLSQGKRSSVLSWYDLPSMRDKERPENNVEIRKAFLKDISNSFKNK